MAIVRSDSHGDLNPTVLAKELFQYTMPNLVAGNVVDKRFGNYKVGATIDIPVTSRLAPSSKTQGTDLTPAVMTTLGTYVTDSTTSRKIQISIDQYFGTAFTIEVYEDNLSQFDIEALYKQSAMDGMQVKIDASVLALGSGFTLNAGSTTAPLGDEEIRSAIQQLRENDVPKSPGWNAVVSPAESMSLLALERFSSRDYVDGDVVTTGRFAKLYGVTFHETNQVPTSGNGHANMLLHPEAIALAMRKEPFLTSLWQPLGAGKQYSVVSIWGNKRTRNDAYAGKYGVTLFGQ